MIDLHGSSGGQVLQSPETDEVTATGDAFYTTVQFVRETTSAKSSFGKKKPGKNVLARLEERAAITRHALVVSGRIRIEPSETDRPGPKRLPWIAVLVPVYGYIDGALWSGTCGCDQREAATQVVVTRHAADRRRKPAVCSGVIEPQSGSAAHVTTAGGHAHRQPNAQSVARTETLRAGQRLIDSALDSVVEATAAARHVIQLTRSDHNAILQNFGE